MVELDGGQHLEQVTYDARRDEDMRGHGFRTLRFWDNDVLKQTDAVLQQIHSVASTLTPTLSRQRERGQDKT